MKTLNFKKINTLTGLTLNSETAYILDDVVNTTLFELYIPDKNSTVLKHIINKADVSQLINNNNTTLPKVLVVPGITERNNLVLTSVSLVLVTDATGDSSVLSGSATYIYDPATTTWTKISDQESLDNPSRWSLKGNSNTTNETDFIGTTTNKSLSFRVNNISSGYIIPDIFGNTSFGFNTPGPNSPITGTKNTFYGNSSGKVVTTGASNTLVGFSSGILGTTLTENTAIGAFSLNNCLTASYNTAVGFASLYNNTISNDNTAIGYRASYYLGSDVNVAETVVGGTYVIKTLGTTNFTLLGAASNTVGTTFIMNNTIPSGNGTVVATYTKNTTIGNNSSCYNIIGFENTSIGNDCSYLSKQACRNVSIGYQAGYYNVSCSENTIIGTQAGLYTGSELPVTSLNPGSQYKISFVGTTDFTLLGAASNTVGLSFTANSATKTGTGTASLLYGGNTLIGMAAGTRLNNTQYNVAIGVASLVNLSSMSANGTVAIGSSSQNKNIRTSQCTTIGYNSGFNIGPTPVITMSSGNSYIIETIGTTDFTLLGASSNTVGLQFTHNGVVATGTGTVSSIFGFNTFIGNNSGYGNTVGSYNTALGAFALYGSYTGINNTAIGSHSLRNNHSQTSNTAVGYFSGINTGIAIPVTKITISSVYRIETIGTTDFTLLGASSNTVGLQFTHNGVVATGTGTVRSINGSNCFFGSLSGNANSSGYYNVFMGAASGYRNDYGMGNTFIGTSSGFYNTDSSNNVYIGYFSGYGTSPYTSSPNNVSIGSYSLSKIQVVSNHVGLGHNTATNLTYGTDNTFLGNSSCSNLGKVIPVTQIISGLTCYIVSIGTTNFTLLGAASNTVGLSFTSTGAGTGTGTVNVSCIQNTTVGSIAAVSLLYGNGCMVAGYAALLAATYSSNTVSIGASSGRSILKSVNNTFLGTNSAFYLGLTNISVSVIVVGKSYIIETLGTTDFTLSGAASNTVGLIFTATSVPTGTGTVTPTEPSNSNIVIGVTSASGFYSGSNNVIIGNSITTLPASLNNNIIIADGSGNRRINIDSNGLTGINVITPKTTLDVNGSISVGIRVITTSTTIAVNDRTIICNNGANAINVTLPTASSFTGRILTITRASGSTGTINLFGGNIQTTTGVYALTDTMSNLGNSGSSRTYQSDGTNWYLIA